MKRLWFILTILFTAVNMQLVAQVQDTVSVKDTVVAQVVQKKVPDLSPDLEKIRDFADSRKYSKLMRRYEKNDPTMSVNDYRQLYFGYVFQSEYQPYQKNDYSQSISTLYYKEHLSRVECDSIIKYAEMSLKDDPFDLQQMNYLIYAYKEKKKHNLARHWQTRLNNVLRAILSTGTGETQETAWHVINIGHEYALINFMSPHYVVERQEFIEPHYDHIILKRISEHLPAGFYFNIKYMLDDFDRSGN